MNPLDHFLAEHQHLTRRFFLKAGAVWSTSSASWQATLAEDAIAPELARAVEELGSYFTPQEDFGDVSRGKNPSKLSDEEQAEIGMTRKTWQLEVITDPDKPATVGKQFTKNDGTALKFDDLVQLGKKHAVRFPKVLTCLNGGCPLGMGLWEGVPLREVIWLTEPRENLRRVFYYGYRTDNTFRSSLPIGRVLEDPFDLPPVILCYKLNGDWLNIVRGGPVRVVVPEAYGFKSIKWLTKVVLTNLFHANDSYESGNNDIDTYMKSFAETLSVPGKPNKDQPLPITGYAQVGVSGLSKVQVWVHPKDPPWSAKDPYFTTAPWVDAQVLTPPTRWGGKLPDEAILKETQGFDAKTGRPLQWPMRFTKAHWAILLPGLPRGEYVLRSRTIDEKGHAQPMPRPFNKSGKCTIKEVSLTVQ